MAIARRICLYASIGIVGFLTSCKLGHQFSRPELDMPGQFDSDMNMTDTFSIADVDWRTIYTDPELQSLIELTLANNKDLRIADARIREMAAGKRIDVAGLFPQINGNAYVQKEGLNYGGDRYRNDPENGIKLAMSWEIDLWGNLRWAKDRGTAAFMESVEGRRALQVTLIAQVAQSYFELTALDHELMIVRQTLKARQEGERLAKLRFEGGLTSETSYQQAKVELERTATHIPILERNIAVKENEIAFLAGEYFHTIKRRQDPRNVKLPDTLPVGMPSTLLERRPDIRAAEQSLIAANAEMGMAYTNRFPRLTLTGQFGVESDEFVNLLKSPMHFISAGLLGPVFDMGRRQASYRAKQAAYEQEVYSYEKTVLNAFKEVRNAIIDFNKVKEMYSSALQLERSAKTTMELAQLQYINGVIGYLDVLDAQRSYFDAQVGLSNAVRNKQLCLVQLYRALGGGWQE